MSDLVTPPSFYSIGIVGWRKYTDYDEFKYEVTEFIDEITEKEIQRPTIQIVSGGAKGTDKMAEQYAKEYKYSIKIFPIDYCDCRGAGSAAYRNKQIVKESTHLIAFIKMDKNVIISEGTAMTVNFAKNKNIPIYIHYI